MVLFRPPPLIDDASPMWFLRAVELDSGEWACRHGLHEFDTHATMHDAIRHLGELRTGYEPAEIVVHWSDGRLRVADDS